MATDTTLFLFLYRFFTVAMFEFMSYNGMLPPCALSCIVYTFVGKLTNAQMCHTMKFSGFEAEVNPLLLLLYWAKKFCLSVHIHYVAKKYD